MLKKTITYTDFNDVERTEDFYFNLSRAEITEMELSVDGGLTARIKKISESKNVPEIMKTFKEIILKAYGEKSDDGKQFIKSAEISNAFANTNAYDELFMQLCTDEKSMADFIAGIVPKEAGDKLRKESTKLVADK